MSNVDEVVKYTRLYPVPELTQCLACMDQLSQGSASSFAAVAAPPCYKKLLQIVLTRPGADSLLFKPLPNPYQA